MNKKSSKMNTLGIVFIIAVVILSILTMHYFYSPPAPISNTVSVPLDSPAPLNDNHSETHHTPG